MLCTGARQLTAAGVQQQARLPHVSVIASVRMGPVCAFRKRVGFERSKPPAMSAKVAASIHVWQRKSRSANRKGLQTT